MEKYSDKMFYKPEAQTEPLKPKYGIFTKRTEKYIEEWILCEPYLEEQGNGKYKIKYKPISVKKDE